MADQEIAKHTKQVMALAASKEHGPWHKLREMLLEMVTIVFAVTLSMWLHGWGEHRHEQQQVKAFLVGLRADLQSDVRQAEDVVQSHRAFDTVYAYLAALPEDGKPDAAFAKAYDEIIKNAALVPQLARFEGFKSSGKLTNIEDAALLERVVTLYEFDIPKVNLSFGGWESRHRKLLEYVDEKMTGADTPEVRYAILTSPKGKRLLALMQTHPQVYERYGIVVQHARDIVAKIDKAYPPA
jgi:hypothetical protein